MITFRTYWPLVLIGTLPYFWWVSRQTLTDLNPRHLRLATIVRSVTLGFIVLALSQPVLNRTGNWISVVYLLDVSRSVRPQEMSDAIDWIEATNREGNPDHARFIPFAANSLVFDEFDEMRTVPVSDVEAEGAVDQSATDLESALAQASRSFAPNHLKRLVLISDGNENLGEVKNAVLRMARENVRVFTHTMQTRGGADAWVEAIMAPKNVSREELFPVDVHVQSLVRATGKLELRFSSQDSEVRDVQLNVGVNRFAFEIRSDETGPLILEAEIQIDGDRFPENNIFRESVVVNGPPRVLYVEGRRESADYLSNVLTGEGLEVDVIGPEGLGSRLVELDSYDGIILSDVPARTLTPLEMELVASYVRDLGGGLILVGGESVYGEDGYSETPIEEILPIRFDLERPSVALIIVLDKSGSMGGQKLDLAKEASKAAVAVLRDDHLIGIVAFDYLHYWPVELRTAENREQINQFISRILAGGETNIYPALEEAYQKLTGVDAEVKHIILLSDGRSLPEDFEGLVREMAEDDVTVSTVAVGNGADRQLLTNIATWGNGRSYFMEDATRVPQVFTDEAELATQGTLLEEPFQVVLRKQVEAFKGIDFSGSPPLLGYVSTLGKDTAEILLESDVGKPILARWQYGLGKTVAFTSDAKDRWAAEWLGWDGYSKLWPQLVRETIRRGDNGKLDLRVDTVGSKAKVSVSAINQDSTFLSDLDSQLSVIDPTGKVSILEIHHSGPGRYETEYTLSEKGPYMFRMVGEDGGPGRIVPYSYPEEYHFYPPNVDLLTQLSRTTGGVPDAEAADIFAVGDESILRPTPLWPYLAAVALALYLVDIFLRRIRLFEDTPLQPRRVPSGVTGHGLRLGSLD